MTPEPASPATSPRTAGVAALFDRSAGTYDQVGVPWFGPIARRLVELAAPAPGERVLDLGCGRGAVTVAVAAAVGTTGRVTAVDLSQRMLELLAEDLRASGTANVDLSLQDVAEPSLPPGEADVVLASLVLFFLPDPADALRLWTALLRPGGRLGTTTFGPQDDVWRRVDALFDPYLPAQLLDARTAGRAGPFGSDAGVESLFIAAGLVDVSTDVFDLEVAFADVETWSRWTWSHGQRAMWEHVPDGERPALVAAAASVLDEARDAGGTIRLSQTVRATLGRRADR